MNKKYLIFRKLNLNDVNRDYLRWFSDPEVIKNINFKPKSIIQIKKNLSDVFKEKNTLFYGIFYKKKIIGTFKIRKISQIHSNCRFGILIGDKKFRDKKIGRLVLEFVKNWCKKNNINSIGLGVRKKNIRAIKLYVNSGFKIKKIFKNKIEFNYDLRLNKIILGFAQINSNYGIANQNKIMSLKKSIMILKSFKNKFSNQIDYSENYSSDILKFSSNIKHFKIDTKINSNKYESNMQILKIIKKYSNKNLKINTFYIHDGDNFFTKRSQKLYKFLLNLKKKKLITKIGISIYNFEILKKIKKKQIDVIQLPHNIIDNRIYKYSNYIKKIDCEIYVRSIFLQGSLLNRIDHNKKLNQVYDKIDILSNKLKVTKSTICLNHVYKNPLVSKIIVGVNSIAQINNLLKFKNLKKNYELKLPDKIINYAIDPSNW